MIKLHRRLLFRDSSLTLNISETMRLDSPHYHPKSIPILLPPPLHSTSMSYDAYLKSAPKLRTVEQPKTDQACT